MTNIRPHRLARSRTRGSQPLNTGSNPVGATILMNKYLASSIKIIIAVVVAYCAIGTIIMYWAKNPREYSLFN
jgi:hypothetical protein